MIDAVKLVFIGQFAMLVILIEVKRTRRIFAPILVQM